MTSMRQIRAFARKVGKEFAPQRVILFGSYARGDATDDSDVDLLIIMRTKKRGLEQALEIRLAVPCTFALDLLVRTPKDIERRVAWNDFFIKDILAEGKVLYDSAST